MSNSQLSQHNYIYVYDFYRVIASKVANTASVMIKEFLLFSLVELVVSEQKISA